MDVGAIRALAENLGYIESIHHSSGGILIFEAVEIETSVSIWYQTGTVGVKVPHPRRDRVTSFFFNVNEQKLEVILAHPWHNETLGYAEQRSPKTSSVTDIESEDSALRKQIALLELEERDIVGEKALLQKRLNDLSRPRKNTDGRRTPGSFDGSVVALSEMERRKRELASEIQHLEKQKAELKGLTNKRQHGSLNNGENLRENRLVYDIGLKNEEHQAKPLVVSEAAGGGAVGKEEPKSDPFRSMKSAFLDRTISSMQRNLPSRYKGNRCMYSIENEEYQEEFAKAWAEKPVHTVGLLKGYVIVYEDGSVAWWDIPQPLEEKFKDENALLPPVKFVVLGAENHYFIKYVNGKMEWVTKNSFQKAIHLGIEEGGLFVDKVALGPEGSWIILWSDGSTSYEGIPPELTSVIVDTKEQGLSIREINLGPSGEWFAILSDHSVQANNLPNTLHKALSHIKQGAGRVRSIVFGLNSSFYVRYWNGKP